MMMMSLTKNLMDAMRIIQEIMDKTGVAPTRDELARELGLVAKSGAHRLVNALIERGYLERLPKRARALRILVRVPPAPEFEFTLTPEGERVARP